MPTTIAIEAKDVKVGGLSTPYRHLYLVWTVTDASGRVLEERVIRGGPGPDGTVATLAGAPLARSPDARGSESPAERHHTVIDLGGRDPGAVWDLMVRHARGIDAADLPYGTGVIGPARPGEVNSNTVVGSALHAIGVGLAQNLPKGVSPSDAPLFNRLGAMDVDDRFAGGAGSDLMAGGAGQDRLLGRDGDDRLAGEAESDVLDGGAGRDVLVGGAGSDRFVFATAAHSPASAPDRIADFRGGIDRIDLRAVDAEAGTAGHQGFAFIDGRAFTGRAGELRFAGGVLEGDRDGDGAADFAIRLAKAASLSADDLLL